MTFTRKNFQGHDITASICVSGIILLQLLLTTAWCPLKFVKSVVPTVGGDFTGDRGLHMELPKPLDGLSGLGGGVSTLFLRNSSIFDATNLPCDGDCLNLCVGVLFALLSELELFVFSTGPFDVILLIELELTVLPVLLLRPLTLNLANGSAV